MSETRPWSNGLFSCCSPFGTCCMASWCPCILFGKTKYRVRNNGSLEGYSCCNGPCNLYCLAQLVTPLRLMMSRNLRAEIREQHNLEGGSCGDCFKACCCECCSLVQQEKEVIERSAEREKMMGKQPGYQPNGAMQYGA
ncbi:PLAC8 family-domain-containing protein [Geopyxis carbonaria]|nr:PLAC8 family-domain-containing protein [Geopyxis carbonaria]